MLDDIVKGLVTQFPVVAVVAVIVWWVLRWTTERHDAERKRDDERLVRLLAEKDLMVAEKEIRIAERDARIAELKAEVLELKGKLSRSPQKPKPDSGAGKPS